MVERAVRLRQRFRGGQRCASIGDVPSGAISDTRGVGVATYAALRELGRAGVAELIERCCEHARRMVTRMGALDGVEVLWEPTINQGLVRFLDPTGADHDGWTEQVIARAVSSGEAFFGATTWRGKRAMRVSVCNWRTTDDDVERAIGAVSRVLGTRK